MAKCKKISNSRVLLGFEDEAITEKNKFNVGYWTNKIGGCPDWPVEGVSHPSCKLCGLKQLLIIQVYAPLESSPYHRTLYVFACLNPNCWNQSQSWTCLRSQLMDTTYDTTLQAEAVMHSATDWCSSADDWEDVDNGNVEMCSNAKTLSDESDDSSSLSAGLGNLHVDECNANWEATGNSGAVGKQTSPAASAEIEGDEGEVVTIDTPTSPQEDIVALLQEAAAVPPHLRCNGRTEKQLAGYKPLFMTVWEEPDRSHVSTPDHVRDLIQEYQARGGECHGGGGGGGDGGEPVTEQYERTVPIHGDKMFHQFLSRIQANPGQVLRYMRDGEPPLLLYPLHEPVKKCSHCGGDLVFEMQLLPTLIPKLRLQGEEGATHLEFGTVLVYTCKKSCWSGSEGAREERLVVQVEHT